MADKTVLLTGASSGMGKAAAMVLAAEGYRVFAGMRDADGRNAGAARDLAGVAAAFPIRAVEIDITDDGSVLRGVQTVLAETGQIDVLVNSAGILWTGIAEAFSAAQLLAIVDTNLAGPFRMLKAVLPHMRQRHNGLCITITAVAGKLLMPGMGIYSASKAGLGALAETIGYEAAPFGIDSVVIEPGMFQTNLLANQQPPADPTIVQSYGDHGSPFAQVVDNVGKAVLTAGPELMDPDAVARLISEIIGMPQGQRPVRTTVGLDFGAGAVNGFTAPIQREFLDRMGF